MSVVRRAGVPGEIEDRRRRVSAFWRPFRSLKRFLAEHFPREWEEIRSCRFSYRVYESKDRPGHYKVTPFACWRIPFCIACTRAANVQRTLGALDRFARVTPKGKPARFVHVVMTAPLTEDGEGWGAKASEDVGAFAKVVRNSLEDIYGRRLGGIMSYQDFGERGFKKRHPHMDLTLNGWILGQDGTASALPRVALEGDGRARVDRITADRARVFQLDARPSNVDFSRIIEGRREYYKVLRYQLREIVDLRKLTYSGRHLEWQSYKDQRRTRFTVDEFLRGLFEYRDRFGLWGSRAAGRTELHRPFGYMRKAELRKTQEIMGGESVPHGRGCACGACEDWERVFEDHDHFADSRRRLTVEA